MSLFPPFRGPQNEPTLGEDDCNEKGHQVTFGHQHWQSYPPHKTHASPNVVLALWVLGFVTNFPGPQCQPLFLYCNKIPEMIEFKRGNIWLDHISRDLGPWSLLALTDFGLAAKQYIMQEYSSWHKGSKEKLQRSRGPVSPPKDCDR